MKQRKGSLLVERREDINETQSRGGLETVSILHVLQILLGLKLEVGMALLRSLVCCRILLIWGDLVGAWGRFGGRFGWRGHIPVAGSRKLVYMSNNVVTSAWRGVDAWHVQRYTRKLKTRKLCAPQTGLARCGSWPSVLAAAHWTRLGSVGSLRRSTPCVRLCCLPAGTVLPPRDACYSVELVR